jgi:hypothetical protein
MTSGACAGTGALAEKLQDIITRTAKENSTHSFVPHVTVAGPIQNKTGEEVLKALQDVAATLPVRSLPPPVCPLALLWFDSRTSCFRTLAYAEVACEYKWLAHELSCICSAQNGIGSACAWHPDIPSLGALPRRVS